MKRGIVISLVVIVLLAAAGGGGYMAYTRYFAPVAVAQESVLQTGTVSQGDIVITADGSGNLLPASERALSFKISGVLTEVNVEVGDYVHKGDVLAKLDTLDLHNAVREATYQLEQARFELEKAQRDAKAGTDAAVALKNVEAARLALVNAQGSYASTMLDSDVSSAVREAKAWADFWQSDLGDKWLRLDEKPNSEKRMLEYELAGAKAESATNSWKQIEQDAQNQKTSAWRSVIQAQASYLSAQASYSDTVSGDPVREAELSVLQYEIKLTQAQTDFDNATLTAPMDGIVTEVSAVVGESAGSSSIITLIDLSSPLVRFWVEEDDVDKAIVGNKVNVTLEALPDSAFTGKIIRVEPVLVTEGNTSAVQVWASLDDTSGATLLSGMTAEVEVVAAETRNALLVPVGALRKLAEGQYAVFVVKDDGELEMRSVQVGLRDLVNAEIVSGVQLGEAVSLGDSSTGSTQSTQSSSSGQQQNIPPGGDMMMGPPGGMP